LILKVLPDRSSLGKAAADHAAREIREAIRRNGSARIIAASAASQFEFLEALVQSEGIDWPRVELFHLDEYIGIPPSHPASFCKFLEERLISKTGITQTHLLNGVGDTQSVIRAASEAVSSAPVDVAFIGIGENGHIAFNDPPADFETEDPFLVVALDEACRRQQVGEGWYKSIDEVPTHAISMSVLQILKAKEILAIVPDQRKAQAIKKCFDGEITPLAPASMLRTHPRASIYLDIHSAALLNPRTLAAYATAG
jgi:glucosamine-6-phosphate deaminase